MTPGATVDLDALIRDIPDFPKPGVMFKDITPLLADAAALSSTIDRLAEPHIGKGVTQVVGMEARGFILAPAVACRLGAGFVPVRKAGKLPSDIERLEYDLEYGTDLLEIHSDALGASDRVLIIDDVLATGGTAAATVQLVERLGATVLGLAFLIDLEFLGGAAKLPDREILSLLTYS